MDLNLFDYKRADSIALHFPKGKYKSYTEIVAPLISNLRTEQEIFRVIFRWIADNVSYSYSNKTDDPEKVIKKDKAVCAGYSSLLKEMCNSAGLECEIISGWSKVDQDDIGQNKKEPDHAWNAIKLDGKWYLTDVTWATSSYDKMKRKFHKEFDTSYFLPTPGFFIEQHFPKDKKWQMLDTLVKKSWFIKSRVWYEDADKVGVKIINPTKGRINQNIKKDFTLILQVNRFKLGTNIDFIIDNNFKQTQESETVSNTDKGSVTIKCRFPKGLKGEHDVNVYFDGQAICGFRMNFH